MKIGIDARMYRSSAAGIGRYSQNLIKNLLKIDHKNHYILFMTSEDIKEFKSFNVKSKNCKIIKTDIPHYSISEQTNLPSVISRENLDLMHFLNFNHPIRYKGKFLVTIHDLTLFFYPETARQSNFIKRKAYQYVMKNACQKSSKIIAVSKSTKKDIIKVFKTSPSKIVVIPEAADDKILKNPSLKVLKKIKKNFCLDNQQIILYVGQWRPHKNLAGLIKAFNILKKKIDVLLVLIGRPDPKFRSVQQTIDKLNLKRDIKLPGFVSEEELAAWYNLASIFVFPSFYEGFGLPGLEAMATGTPVISSDRSSLAEVYQDAVLYFDPSKPEDIADKIGLVLGNKKLQKNLISRGKKLLKKYSWEKTALETLKVYQEVTSCK